MYKKKFAEYAQQHEQELYELVKTIARIPAPTGKEEKRAGFCLDWLKEHGAKEAYMDEAGNVVFLYHADGNHVLQSDIARTDKVCGLDENTPLIVFDAHMDVVFPDETELPLEERDGKIYCPGVGDDTANLAVLLMTAAYAIEEQIDTGEHGILFVCGVGEEGLGNLKGVREVCRVFGPRIHAFYAFDLTMEAYTCRAVGSVRYRIEVQTPGGHSYGCFGNTNANVELASLICMLYRIEVPARGKTTYNIGMISGGTSVNTIAQQAEMLYEIRSDNAEDLAELQACFGTVLEEYKKTCPKDTDICVEIIGERPCERDVNEGKRKQMFRKVEDIVERVTGRVPIPKPCSTDCNIPLSMGIPSVCVGTCRGAGAHTRGEFIEKDSLGLGLQIGLGLLEECVK